MTDGLPGDDRPKSPGAFALSGWLVAQLLLAVFLIPAVDGVVQIYRGIVFDPLQSRYLYSFAEFTAENANILWVVQVGLVLNVIGSAAQRPPIRWGAMLAAIFFLFCQDGSYNYTLAIYVSLAAIAGVWLIWDPGPLGWRMLLGTAVGFLLVAAHYALFGRNATALNNALLVLHYSLVGGALLLFRTFGWKLTAGDSATVPANAQAAKFSFSQLFACITCCGLGLALLRSIGFAAPHTLPGRDVLQIGNQELFWSLFIYVLVTPLLCLLAAWTTLSVRLFRYWLVFLAIVAVMLVMRECLGPPPYSNPPTSTSLLIRLTYQFHAFSQAANSCLLVAAIPTAVLLIYRAVGFRWSRVNRAAAGR